MRFCVFALGRVHSLFKVYLGRPEKVLGIALCKHTLGDMLCEVCKCFRHNKHINRLCLVLLSSCVVLGVCLYLTLFVHDMTVEVLLKQLAPELFVIVSLSCDDIMNRRRASALNSLCNNGMHLKHLDDWCVHDHELVLMAVQQYDHELVVMAVQQNGLVF